MTRHGLLIALILTTLPVGAETLSIPLGRQGEAGLTLPVRGESQRAVLERLGLPDQEHSAVGQPPIVRWDYREFSVYFESGRVIDSVRHHQPRTPRE